ncbi:hypothetical protein FKM82_015000 [Ascaphus truei]
MEKPIKLPHEVQQQVLQEIMRNEKQHNVPPKRWNRFSHFFPGTSRCGYRFKLVTQWGLVEGRNRSCLTINQSGDPTTLTLVLDASQACGDWQDMYMNDVTPAPLFSSP